MAEANSYEEQRRRHVEENKRKLDKLRLLHLSAAVREAAKPPRAKSQKRKTREAGVDAPPRRSGRLASLPEQPDYREVGFQKNVRSTKKDLPEQAYAVTKAEELEAELGSDYPTFIKSMTQSHVTGSRLNIPAQFDGNHLPERKGKIILVDEEDEEFDTLFRADNNSLSGEGWKDFVMDHELVDGDCLVFQMVKKRSFKVYIIRASSYYEDNQ